MSFKLTHEQEAIIEHQGNARIKAFAGTGKTSTLVEYSKPRHDSKILYIAYNRSVKDEAKHKFKKACINNVRIETAHSLAYQDFDVRNKFKLHKNGGCKPLDLLNMSEIKRLIKGDTRYGLILSKHILAYMSLYCNSAVKFIGEIDYISTIQDETAKKFVKSNLQYIRYFVNLIMNKLLTGEMDMSHDAYLKFWQLSKPRLDYDIILFDEGQDASPVMLETFLNQDHAVKIIVGDEHQQIYSFRSAINSLNQVDYPEFYLTNSFRFPQHIADTAMKAINLKTLLNIDVSNFKLTGLGNKQSTNHMAATLARNNLTLLNAAIETVFEKNVQSIYFEGNLTSYTYMREGGNLYDILNLLQEKHSIIKDPLIATFKNIEELEEYQEATNDHEIMLMANIVKKYKGSLGYYLSNLKKCQVEKHKAEMIFSTVHKAKGMEYKNVTLCDDFIDRQSILELIESPPANLTTVSKTDKYEISVRSTTIDDPIIQHLLKGGKLHHNHCKGGLIVTPLNDKPIVDPNQLAEEINILYVAVTRAQDYLDAPIFS